MKHTFPKQNQQPLAILGLVTCLAVPVAGHAQCEPAGRSARRDSSLAHPLTAAPDSLAASGAPGTARHVATSRSDPKVAGYRDGSRQGRVRVTKESCGEVGPFGPFAPPVAMTPYGVPGGVIPAPIIPAPMRVWAPHRSHAGIFGAFLIGGAGAVIAGRRNGGDDGVGGSVGGTVPPGVVTPGGDGTTPPTGNTPTDTTSTTPGDMPTPEVPDIPDVPGTPGAPGTPDVPEVPGVPGTPTGPGTPGVPGIPGVPDGPGIAGTPGTPFTPGVPGDNPGGIATSAVPEPSTILLVGGGLIALVGLRRRRR